jgi:hypothetical protein
VPLREFKARGWYVDDLVLTPVDQMSYNSRERKAACAAARDSLAQRIAEYKPASDCCAPTVHQRRCCCGSGNGC